ncbi:hypothetical protein GN958_ATG07744 [Phytophthora infestans]|uniref:Uncharacterized protein n=1 Tax=Phytophthora infestans TaxID=4787 RepID=A0A8S9UY94_PHYIN|nr:hypothetical protein GN958_ATG07744 [Phytophthora infestans]
MFMRKREIHRHQKEIPMITILWMHVQRTFMTQDRMSDSMLKKNMGVRIPFVSLRIARLNLP